MEKSFVEIPQVEIPDEFTQIDLPEIGETTPHPEPTSPQDQGTTRENASIGFVRD